MHTIKSNTIINYRLHTTHYRITILAGILTTTLEWL